jgi:hypothetical protein
MNDVPVPLSAMMTFVFTTDGSYAAPAPFSRNPRPVEPGIKMVESTVAVQSAGPVSTSTSPPVPPAPPGLIPSQMARLAVESAAKGEPVPIPFDAAGPARHGVLFDAFRIAVLRARAARAGTGSPTAAESPAPPPPHMVAVAYPLTCGERQIKPIDVQIHAGAGVRGPVRTLSGLLPGDALASELPGATLPAGAVGRLLQVTAFSSSLEAHVTYAEPPCGASSAVVILPIQWVRGEARPNLTLTQLPKDSKLSSPTVVRLRGIVDLDGVYRFPTIAEGPPELEVAAAAVASQWRYVPYRANGVAVPQSLITTLTFRD